eukprot:SAG22_NODE_1168_length_5271_cov_13.249613_3_plen_224_part_00
MPRDLSVAASDGRLHIVPVPEISNLKLSGVATTLAVNGTAKTLGAQVMVQLTCSGLPPPVAPAGVDEPDLVLQQQDRRPRQRQPPHPTQRAVRAVGVDVLLDSAAGEWTRVGYDLDTAVLFVDQGHTNAAVAALSDAYQTTAPLPEVTGRAVTSLNMTVLVDGGLLESFLNCQVVISSLLSPGFNTSSSSEPAARQVRAFSTGGGLAGLACRGEAWALRDVPH